MSNNSRGIAKKTMAIVLVLIMVISMLPSAVATNSGNTENSLETQDTLPFTDVSNSKWYYENVVYVYENEVMIGTGNNRFEPEITVTRAQFVKAIANMAAVLGYDTSGYLASDVFADVKAGTYYDEPMGWAKHNDILVGTSSTEAQPNEPVTREQMATFLYRYVEFLGYEYARSDAEVNYSDKDSVNTWASAAVTALTKAGIFNGIPENGTILFKPQEASTRAQMAALLHRLLDGGINPPPVSSETVTLASRDGVPSLGQAGDGKITGLEAETVYALYTGDVKSIVTSTADGEITGLTNGTSYFVRLAGTDATIAAGTMINGAVPQTSSVAAVVREPVSSIAELADAESISINVSLSTGLLTEYAANDAENSATAKIMKYAGGETEFADKEEWNNTIQISTGDIFVIKVTAEDGVTTNYYKITVARAYDTTSYYTARGFNVPGLTFQPTMPDTNGVRFEPTEVYENVYFIGDTWICCMIYDTGDGLILWDALECADDIVNILEPDMRKLGLDPADIKIVLLSHGHGDHYGGSRYLQDTYGAKVYMHPDDLATFTNDTIYRGEKPVIDEWYDTGVQSDGTVTLDTVTLGDVTFTLMHTPGHTPGSTSFFVPVTDFNGEEHILTCWGGTSAPRDAAGVQTYRQSAARYREYINANGVDSFLSMHPFVDYSTDNVTAVRNTGTSAPLIQTAAEMDLFCWSLNIYTQLRGTGDQTFPNTIDGYSPDILNWPFLAYIPEDINGSQNLDKEIASEIFDNVYLVGTGKDACLIFDTPSGIVIVDAMTGQSDFTGIVLPAMQGFGLDPTDIKAVMLTSGLADKTGFAQYVKSAYGAEIYMNNADSTLSGFTADKNLADYTGAELNFGGFTFNWYSTPGQTPGTMSFIIGVEVEGVGHTAACWGGTTLPDTKEALQNYCESINAFLAESNAAGADAIVSTNPYFDFSYNKANAIENGYVNADFVLPTGTSAFIIGEELVRFTLTSVSVTAKNKLGGSVDTVILTSMNGVPSLGQAGNGKITGLEPNTVYALYTGGVKSIVTSTAGGEITGLINRYYFVRLADTDATIAAGSMINAAIPRTKGMTTVYTIEELRAIGISDPDAVSIWVSATPGLTTTVEANNAANGAAAKIMKYAAGETEFADTEEWTNETPIDDGDIFVIKVTAEDGVTTNYYKIFARAIDYEAKTYNGSYIESLPYRQSGICQNLEGQSALVIMLHGNSGSGADNIGQLSNLGPAINDVAGYLETNGIKSILIVPQCPRQTNNWNTEEGTSDLKALIDDIVTNNPDIDTDKIYIMGVSMGGDGVWRMLAYNPGFFAAAMTVDYSPGVLNAVSDKVAELIQTPLCIVVGDPGAGAIRTAAAFADELEAAGGDIRYAILEGDHVFACRNAFLNDEHLDWVFSYKLANKDATLAASTWINAAMPRTITTPWATDMTPVSTIDELRAIGADDDDAFYIWVSNETGLITTAVANDPEATVKIMKYTSAETTFADKAEWTSADEINDGDIFVIKVTAADGVTTNYYKIFAKTIDYQEKTFTGSEITLPYRQIDIGQEEQGKSALVIHLHGNSGRESDNIGQLNNSGPVFSSIAGYLETEGIKSILIAPQCPTSTRWNLPDATADLKALIDDIVANNDIDTDRIYITGLSMGGYGVLRMLAEYPGFFASAITIDFASEAITENPGVGTKLTEVAQTPLYIVIATEGQSFDTAPAFADALKDKGGDVEYEIMEGDHIFVCINSFFGDSRLEWVFSHTLG